MNRLGWTLAAVISISGCVDEPQPDPAMVNLMRACDGGDTQACSTVAQLNQQRRIALAQSLDFTPTMTTTPQLSPVVAQPPTRTICRNVGAQLICDSY